MTATAWVPFRIEPAIPAWAQQMAPVCEEAVKATAPVGAGDGAHVRDTIEATATALGVDVTGSDIALFQSTGTRPHHIHTDKPHGLVFEWHGSMFHGYDVDHPGTGPNDYLERAAEVIGEQAEAIFGSLVEAIWAEGS